MKYPFSNSIITWYKQNKRDLPWRLTTDPYKIWLSEVILQQTRVVQGLPYYQDFINTYPKIQDLAEASEQDILKLWQGLGYYSRARNLHATAKLISEKLDGIFPANYNDLLKLKGVGDYTASAIASFCYNEITPTVDGNVYRVLARYFGIKTPINSTIAKKEFKLLAKKLIDEKEPGLFNQSIMEFGALQCKPKQPNCKNCPLSNSCVALQKEQVHLFPYKDKRLKIKKRYFNYLVIQTVDHKTVMKQRKGKGIWQNLYEFPVIETTSEIDFLQLIQKTDFLKLVNYQDFNLQELTPDSIVHKLSHQHLRIKFWLLKVSRWHQPTLTIDKAKSLPVPIIIHKFIDKYWPNDMS
jgi:A/G-specific adenine glycosylase